MNWGERRTEECDRFGCGNLREELCLCRDVPLYFSQCAYIYFIVSTGIRNKENIVNESKLTDFSNINSLNININSFKELTMIDFLFYATVSKEWMGGTLVLPVLSPAFNRRMKGKSGVECVGRRM